MDVSVYCRSGNKIGFDTFINALTNLNLVLLGENHVSEVHTVNEERIITELLKRRKIHLLTEDYACFGGYQEKREMLGQFNFFQYTIVNSDNQDIARKVCEAPVEEALVLAIIGNQHLQGIHAVDALVQRMIPQFPMASVHQLGSTPEGIYNARILGRNDYVLSGEI